MLSKMVNSKIPPSVGAYKHFAPKLKNRQFTPIICKLPKISFYVSHVLLQKKAPQSLI